MVIMGYAKDISIYNLYFYNKIHYIEYILYNRKGCRIFNPAKTVGQ